MSRDTIVRCDKRDGHGCGREERVDFATGLRTGWPKCGGYTMRLVTTEADIEQATGKAIRDQLPASR